MHHWLQSLRQPLPNYQPCDPAESHALTRMRAFLTHVETTQHARSNGTCALIDRTNATPGHFTASALVLCPNRQRIALILHRKLHLWLQPGGHIESTDTSIITAAQREAHEECGVITTVDPHRPLFHLDVHTIPTSTSMPAHQHFDIRVLLHATTDHLAADSDAQDAKWFDLIHVAEHNAITTDDSVRRAVRKILAP